MSRRRQICCLERDRFLSYRQLHSCYILTWRTEKALVSLLHLKDTNKCHHGCSTLMTSFKPNDFSFTLLNIITLKVRVKSANPFLINLSFLSFPCSNQSSSLKYLLLMPCSPLQSSLSWSQYLAYDPDQLIRVSYWFSIVTGACGSGRDNEIHSWVS